MEERKYANKAARTDEERKGLLSDSGNGLDGDDELDLSLKPKSRRGVYVAAVGMIILMLGAVFGPPLLRGFRSTSRPVVDFDSQKLRSNGTHYFKKTALIVSIDGLR